MAIAVAMAMGLGVAAWGAPPEARFIAAGEIPARVEGIATEIGGISGLAYDGSRGVWIAVSDAKTGPNVLELRISLGPAVTLEVPARPTLRVDVLRSFHIPARVGARGPRDAEAIAIAGDGAWFVGFESPPCVARVDVETAEWRTVPVSRPWIDHLRPNRSFESVAWVNAAGGAELWAGTENAPNPEETATRGAGQRCRVLVFDPASFAPRGEFVYLTQPLAPRERSAQAFAALAELAAMPDGRMLALEKSRDSAEGENAQVFVVRAGERARAGAAPLPLLEKTLIADLRAMGAAPRGTMEAMAVGPALAEGQAEMLLVILEDNNFAPGRGTQVVALGLKP